MNSKKNNIMEGNHRTWLGFEGAIDSEGKKGNGHLFLNDKKVNHN
jgi:hypothetical protein